MTHGEELNRSVHKSSGFRILHQVMIMVKNSSKKQKGYRFELRFLPPRWKPSVIFVRILLALLGEELVDLTRILERQILIHKRYVLLVRYIPPKQKNTVKCKFTITETMQSRT